MLIIISLIASFIPSIVLYIYLKNLRKQDSNYQADCRGLLIGGVLCSLGVCAIDLVLTIVWGLLGIAKDMPIVKEIFRTFVIAAFAEEIVKYMTGNKYVKKRIDKVSWLDCIAFFAIVGIGFQLIESVVYLISSNPIQILVKGITMGHPSYGMLMGYFVGKALYTGDKKYTFIALALPILLHGLYDFSLSDEFIALNDNLVFVPFILIGIELFILIRMLLLIKKEKRNGTQYTVHISQLEK